jgi:hypothetical protein
LYAHINEAWKKLFARVEFNKDAIAARGWYPLTRNLLDHPEISATKENECKEIEEMDTGSSRGASNQSKSLEAQRLEHTQQWLDDQFQQVAKEFGLPMDLLQNGGKKQKPVEENNVTTLDKHYQEKKWPETQSPNSKNNNGEGGTMVQLDNKAV